MDVFPGAGSRALGVRPRTPKCGYNHTKAAGRTWRRMDGTADSSIEKPEDVNFILGQSHFIKTVEDLHEVLVGTVPGIKFGVAFCEASGKCLVRWTGTDEAMIELAKKNALRIGAGHSFIVFLGSGVLSGQRAERNQVGAGSSPRISAQRPIRRRSSWRRRSRDAASLALSMVPRRGAWKKKPTSSGARNCCARSATSSEQVRGRAWAGNGPPRRKLRHEAASSWLPCSQASLSAD